MATSITKQAQRLVDLMATHGESAVNNSAITRTHMEGTISAIPTDGTNIYQVLINGEIYKIPAKAGLSLSVGNIVIIQLFNGNINKKWIDCVRPW